MMQKDYLKMLNLLLYKEQQLSSPKSGEEQYKDGIDF